MSAAPIASADTRLTRRFQALRAERRGGLITFTTAGDPDFETSLALVRGLPSAGADVIEIGMPFSDPMADGPAIQASSQRALGAGMTLRRTLELVRGFREHDEETPVVLMGYYNPIYRYGAERFVEDALRTGVDGLIVVDLPPEEDDELCHPALTAGLHWIRLATPTTDEQRLPTVLSNTSGFVYYVSVMGITGTRSASLEAVEAAIGRLRRYTDLPIAVGFGIKTPEQARDVAAIADAAVVGSALVDKIKEQIGANGNAGANLVSTALDFVARLAAGIRGR